MIQIFISDLISNLSDVSEQTSNSQKINTFLQILDSAKKVVLVGVGKSFLVAQLVASMANSFGLKWYAIRGNEAFHGDMGIIAPTDVVLMLSASGKTPELIKLAKILRQNTLLSVTCCDKMSPTPLSEVCGLNIALNIANEKSTHGLAPLTSTAVTLAFLYGALNEITQHIQIEDYTNNHPGGNIGAQYVAV